MKKILLILSSLLVFTISCDDDDPVSNTRSTEVSVMSFNLYAGGDFNVMNTVTSFDQLTETMQDIWLDASLNNGNPRFQSLADMVEEKNPDVILLQDVAYWYEQAPGDFLSGMTAPNATDPVFNNLEALQTNLNAIGDYEVVSRVETTDWEFPRRVGVQQTTTDVRVKLENVILVREGIVPSSVKTEKLYNNNDNLLIESYQLNLNNGFQTIDLQKGGITFTVANSKLIGSDYSAKQVNQAAELIAALPTNKPVIAGLEVNNVPTSNAVQNILSNGYGDAWTTIRGNSNGYTCCISSDLRDASGLSERLTYQFYSEDNVEARSIELLGDDTEEQSIQPGTPYLSNQYGLFAKYRVVVPN